MKKSLIIVLLAAIALPLAAWAQDGRNEERAWEREREQQEREEHGERERDREHMEREERERFEREWERKREWDRRTERMTDRTADLLEALVTGMERRTGTWSEEGVRDLPFPVRLTVWIMPAMGPDEYLTVSTARPPIRLQLEREDDGQMLLLGLVGRLEPANDQGTALLLSYEATLAQHGEDSRMGVTSESTVHLPLGRKVEAGGIGKQKLVFLLEKVE